MQINLPSDADSLIHAQAESAGFGDDISAYLAHLVIADRSETRSGEALKKKLDIQEETALEAFERLGLIGCISDGPADLATNPKHMEGFGQDDPASSR